MSVVLLILGLILFVGLVVIHEFGHFMAARRNGVEVEEFGIGFPPKLKTLTKKNGTIYTLNLLPLGGFVRLKGEHDSDTAKGSFGAASLLTKIKIMLAGVGMNLLVAFIVLMISALVGLPKLIDNQFTIASDTKTVRQDVIVTYVEPGSPAEKSGLKPRDVLVSLGKPNSLQVIDNSQTLPQITKQLAGENIQITYRRDGQVKTSDITLRTNSEVDASKKTNNEKGYLGISPTEYILRRSTWSAPLVAVGLIKQFTILTLKGIASAIAGLAQGNTAKASSQVSGPVGIFVIFREGSHLGIEFILLLVGLISLTLAIMNVLPIPALDGGRLFITLIFRLLRRPLKDNVEDIIHGSGFVLLMLLFVLITIVDIHRFF